MMQDNDNITRQEELALKAMESFYEPDDKSMDLLDDDGVMSDCRDLADIEAALREEAHPVDVKAELELFHEHHNHRRAIIRRISFALAAAAVFIGALIVLLPGNGNNGNALKGGSQLFSQSMSRQGKEAVSEEAQGASAEQVASTPRAKTKTLTLPDGTKVWLNAGSKLYYPAQFAEDNRTVELKGEAFFSVTHDASRPFIVKSGSLQTKVLGTKFDVKNYSGSKPMVILVEGKVQVTDVANRSTMTMKPGESVTMGADGSFDVSTNVDADAGTSWKDGYLYYDDVSFGEMIKRVAEWYGLKVECGNAEAMSSRVHITIPNDVTADKAVEMINRLGMANVSISNNKIVVK